MSVLQRARRTKRSFFPWILTLALVATAWFKLVTLSSTLNKMSYQGTWCATNDNLDIKYTFDPASAVSRMPKPLLLLRCGHCIPWLCCGQRARQKMHLLYADWFLLLLLLQTMSS